MDNFKKSLSDFFIDFFWLSETSAGIPLKIPLEIVTTIFSSGFARDSQRNFPRICFRKYLSTPTLLISPVVTLRYLQKVYTGFLLKKTTIVYSTVFEELFHNCLQKILSKNFKFFEAGPGALKRYQLYFRKGRTGSRSFFKDLVTILLQVSIKCLFSTEGLWSLYFNQYGSACRKFW